jgi:hypothetical protein
MGGDKVMRSFSSIQLRTTEVSKRCRTQPARNRVAVGYIGHAQVKSEMRVASQWREIAVLVAWGTISFVLALRWFRWN